jgi:hypothetical protein
MVSVQYLASAEHCLTLLPLTADPAVQAQTLLRLQHGGL